MAPAERVNHDRALASENTNPRALPEAQNEVSPACVANLDPHLLWRPWVPFCCVKWPLLELLEWHDAESEVSRQASDRARLLGRVRALHAENGELRFRTGVTCEVGAEGWTKLPHLKLRCGHSRWRTVKAESEQLPNRLVIEQAPAWHGRILGGTEAGRGSLLQDVNDLREQTRPETAARQAWGDGEVLKHHANL